MDTNTTTKQFTRHGVYKALKARGQAIGIADVYRILDAVEPSGLSSGKYPTYSLESFDEAHEDHRLNVDTTNPELADQLVQERIIKLQLENDAKKKLLIPREDMMAYLTAHQTIVCGILKFYLLNKVPNTLKNPEARQLLLTCYNDVIDEINKGILKWCSITNQQYKEEQIQEVQELLKL